MGPGLGGLSVEWAGAAVWSSEVWPRAWRSEGPCRVIGWANSWGCGRRGLGYSLCEGPVVPGSESSQGLA